MSSSRVHTSFTGAPIAFEISTACAMKSRSMRRPKPPPRKVVSIVICSGLSLVMAAVMPSAACWNWIEPISSAESLRTSAVKFIGSIGECERNGIS